MMNKKVKNALEHPLTAGAVLFGAVGQLSIGWIAPFWELVSSTATYWFPALATIASTILPELGYSDVATPLLLGSAIVFVAVQIDRLLARVADFVRKR